VEKIFYEIMLSIKLHHPTWFSVVNKAEKPLSSKCKNVVVRIHLVFAQDITLLAKRSYGFRPCPKWNPFRSQLAQGFFMAVHLVKSPVHIHLILPINCWSIQRSQAT
jgi:hypothetical protein